LLSVFFYPAIANIEIFLYIVLVALETGAGQETYIGYLPEYLKELRTAPLGKIIMGLTCFYN